MGSSWMRWVVMLGILSLGGCAAVQTFVNEPQVELRDVRVVSMSLTQAQLAFDFDVHNPNPLGLAMRGFNYQLDLQDEAFLSGTHDASLRVGANETSRLTLPITLNYTDLLGSLAGLGRNETLRFRLSGEAQFGPFTVPYTRAGTLPLPRLPEVSVQSVRVDGFNLSGAQLAVGLRVNNANRFPLRLNGFDYQVQFAGASLLRGESTQPLDIAPDQSGMLQLRLWVDYSQMAGLAQLLRQAGSLPVSVAGNVKIPGPAGEVDAPYTWRGELPLQR